MDLVDMGCNPLTPLGFSHDEYYCPPAHYKEWLFQIGSYMCMLLSSPPKPSIVVLSGPPGSGKTLLSKAVLQLYQKIHTSDCCVYLSCRNLGSETEVIYKILSNLGVKPNNIRGFSRRELLAMTFDSIKSTCNGFLLIFDDIDSLLLKGYTFLVDLIPKLHEVDENFGNRIGVVFTSRSEMLIKERFPIGSYYSIRLNITDQTIAPQKINEFVKYSIENNCDMVAGLQVPTNINFVTLRENKLDNNSLVEVKLTKNQMAVLKAISQAKMLKNGYKKIGDVEKIYVFNCSNMGEQPLGHTRIWKITRELEAINVIERRVVSLGRKGRTTLMRLNSNVR